MKFKKQTLENLSNCSNGETSDGLTVIENTITDKFKANLHYRMVFTDGVKFYENTYSVESSQEQWYTSFDYEDDEIECPEVVPQEKVVTVYVSADTAS